MSVFDLMHRKVGKTLHEFKKGYTSPHYWIVNQLCTSVCVEDQGSTIGSLCLLLLPQYC